MQRISNLLATLALAVAATACSSDLAGTPTTGSPSPPATTSSDTAVSGAIPDTAIASPASTEPTASPVVTVPLVADDLGGGWSTTDVDADTVVSLAQLPCPGTELDADVVERLQPTAARLLDLARGEAPLAIQQFVVQGDAEQLADDLDAVFAAAVACLGTDRVDDAGGRVRYDPFELPPLGDQRLGGTVTIAEPPDFVQTIRGHTAIVRVGGTALMLVQYEVLSSPDAGSTFTDARYLDLLALAVDRITDAG